MPAAWDSPTTATNRPNEGISPSTTLIAQDQEQRGVPGSVATETSTLRYRYRALWLLALYVPLLVVPWVLTCVLNYHPVDRPVYHDQSGIPGDSVKLHRRLMNALSVIFAITGLVTVPIVSAILSQAAVVYTQRRRKTQSVSISQIFALADRGWSSPAILYEAWHT
jgi:hypothetical protein